MQPGSGEAAQLERGRARGLGGLHAVEVHRATHHQPRQLARVGVGGRPRARHLAAPHHRHGVGDLEHLAQLVGDEQHRAALGGQLARDREQPLGLLRGQHGGRLVEDQHVRGAVQRAQDLHALLVADRQLADARPRVDAQAVPATELADQLLRRGVVVAAAPARLAAHRDVLGHGQVAEQPEVLVDHPDAVGVGVLHRVDPHGLAVDADLAGVGARRRRRARSSASSCRRRSRPRRRAPRRARRAGRPRRAP